MDYFTFEQDLRHPEVTAIAGTDGLDSLDWLRGEPMDAPRQPLRLPLAPSGGDYRNAIISGPLTVYSDSLKRLLTDLGIDNIDYYPAELLHPETGAEDGYWLVNIRALVECVDVERSTIVPRATGGRGRLESFHVDEARTKGLRLFRLQEQPRLVVVDASVKQAVLNADDVRGVRMRPTSKYDGF